MGKLSKAFKRLETTRSKAFVPYIMAGSDGLATFKEQLLFLQKANATVIEVGLPFSDPTADGPTIQKAGLHALKNGMTTETILNFLYDIKNELSIPIVIMTYFNPIYQYGIERFVAHLKKAGVSGCIIPDLPLEEEDLIVPHLAKAKIDFIHLVTITNSEERLKKIIERSNGFLYAVTVTGTTGARTSFHNDFASFLQKVKKLSTIPVLAGFGISTPAQATEISRHCDGVIVGSQIIDLFEKHDLQSIEQLIHATTTR